MLVSAVLVSGGTAQQAFLKADRQGFFLFSSPTIRELEDVLFREKFDRYVTRSERLRFMKDLLAKSIQVPVTETIRACSDPDDDKFLEVAVSGAAACLVTGNIKDFPASPYRDIPILTPAEFLAVALP